MVRCLVIGVSVGGGTTTGAETDGSVINLGAMTLSSCDGYGESIESPLRYREDGSAVVYFLMMDQQWYVFRLKR
jgi:hypothetical protein